MKIPRDLGWGGAEQQKLAPICDDVALDLKEIKEKLDDLVAKYNDHVHVEGAPVAEAFQGEPADALKTVASTE